MKLKSGSDSCIGNPSIPRPLAVCFNASSSTTESYWDEIRPLSYDSIISAPQNLAGSAIVGGICYILPTEALCDYAEYRFGFVLDAKTGSNPGGDPAVDFVDAILLDKTYYKDDNNNWVVGWEDVSDLASDADIGMVSDRATSNSYKQIYTS